MKMIIEYILFFLSVNNKRFCDIVRFFLNCINSENDENWQVMSKYCNKYNKNKTWPLCS
jgi:hypothetical protein